MNEKKGNVPELSKLKNELPFRVPANYFDDFYARLHTRLEAEEQALPKRDFRVIKYLKPVLGLAASFALIFMLVYQPVKSYLPKYLAKTRAYIKTSNEEDTYFSMIEKLDENSFFALITESSETELVNDNSFNDEELFSYLSSNISNYEIFLQTEN